jgi:class 3 adenylate cyclase/pimeloyl-ACP methyl ester carboxylesterase
VERRLSAVMATDMVGYSRLMEVDEIGVHARQKSYRQELIDPEIARNHGQIIKTTGDGLLVTFTSVQDAVKCSIEIQCEMKKREQKEVDDLKIMYRIGINLGDVIFDDDDIFGDGVNVAARLEGLAEPGGICISDIVFQSVSDRFDTPFRDMGGQRVKNISRPIKVWQWAPDVNPEPEVPEISTHQRVRFCETADGVNLAWASTGHGIPVLKAPNWLGHIEYEWTSPFWGDFLSEFSQRCKLVRFDQRGTGLSDWEVDDISEDRMVDDMLAVADAAGLEHFGLFGISQGAGFVMRFAARYPERVRFLILLNGLFRGRMCRDDPEAENFHEMGKTMIEAGWGSPSPVYRNFFTSIFMPDSNAIQRSSFDEMQRISTNTKNALRILEMNAYLDMRKEAREVRASTLIAHQRNDMFVPVELGREAARTIPGAVFVELPGSNHALIRGQPGFDEFFEDLDSFLVEQNN